MIHVTLSKLRQQLASFLDSAVHDREPIIVTRPGDKGDVVLISAVEYRSLQETVHLLSSPHNAARLMDAVTQIRAGKAQPRTLIEPEA